MSSLTKFLLLEAHRNRIRKTGAGMKTPLVLNLDPHPDLNDFLISTSRGDLVKTNNSPSGVRTNFFEISPEQEEAFFVHLIDEIFAWGYEAGWGGTIAGEDFKDSDLHDVISYFDAYDLNLFQVFCGSRGFEILRDSGLLTHPSGYGEVDDSISEDDVQAWRENYFMSALLEGRPVYLQKELGPYIAFCAPPSFVGLMTRIGDFASIMVHNPERGVVIARLLTEEELVETNDEEE